MSLGQNQKSVTITLDPPYWIFLPRYVGAGVLLEPLAIRAVYLTSVALCWAWHLQLDLWEILAMCHYDMSQSNSNAVETCVATQDRVFPHYVPNSCIKHSKSDSKDRSQEIL
jgi:hypothetical protein